MSKKGSGLKVAIVHDWLYGGGAELVVQELHEMFPEAPIYTSYCSEQWRKKLDYVVVTGYLQKWPFSQLRKFLPVLRQQWFKKLNLSQFDVVISSSGNGEAKFIQVKKPAIHICYCHTPTHFYWRKYDEYLKTPGFRPEWAIRLGLKLLVKPLRRADYAAAQNVDYFIANSSHIQNDIQKYYGQESTIIHPPVDTEDFKHTDTASIRNGYVVWGRHVPYKRFDLAVEACNTLELPLTVIGEGPVTKKLKGLAGPTITFTGRIPRNELVGYAHSAQAFLFPAEEDFGIAPVEALAAGTPVIAYKSGGALDYVLPGKTGEFFTEQTALSLIESLANFEARKFNSAEISAYATKFSAKNFKTKMSEFISTCL